jgi:hypothetical protein
VSASLVHMFARKGVLHFTQDFAAAVDPKEEIANK